MDWKMANTQIWAGDKAKGSCSSVRTDKRLDLIVMWKQNSLRANTIITARARLNVVLDRTTTI